MDPFSSLPIRYDLGVFSFESIRDGPADPRFASFPTRKRDIIWCDSLTKGRSPDGRKRNATIETHRENGVRNLSVSASVGAFFAADHYRKIADDLFNNAGLTYLAGFITVVIGLLVVTYHNRWTKNWTVLITILGWLALVKGIFLIAFPQFVPVC